jgi:nucleoside-diphosphate-sugar epimerase
MATICLRPVAVFDEAGYARMMQAPPAPTSPGRSWHLGVHIDLRDVADAIAKAVACPSPGHARMLLCAADIADRRPTLELVKEHMPRVPWRGGAEFRREPHRALVDCGRARRVLGWEPRHLWPGRSAAPPAA